MASYITKRHNSRKMLVQGLYQWQLSNATIDSISMFVKAENSPAPFDETFFRDALFNTISKHDEYQEVIEPLLDRPYAKLTAVEKAILLIGCFELKHHLETPYKVVMKEAIAMCQSFGATDSFKFINAILDKYALSIEMRMIEKKTFTPKPSNKHKSQSKKPYQTTQKAPIITYKKAPEQPKGDRAEKEIQPDKAPNKDTDFDNRDIQKYAKQSARNKQPREKLRADVPSLAVKNKNFPKS